jgi:hypothetical protein
MHVASLLWLLSFTYFYYPKQCVWSNKFFILRIQLIWNRTYPNINILIIIINRWREIYLLVNEFSAPHIKEGLIYYSVYNNIFCFIFFKFLYKFHFFIPFWSELIVGKSNDMWVLYIWEIMFNFDAWMIWIKLSPSPSCPNFHLWILKIKMPTPFLIRYSFFYFWIHKIFHWFNCKLKICSFFPLIY